ncbi:MAG: hypothetical protein WBM69_21000 [Desulfobacterales bacterium]
MRSKLIESMGEPGTFNLTSDDPMYWTERLSREISLNLYNLEQNGFRFEQHTADDIAGIENTLDTYSANVAAWMPTAIAASESGSPIPSAPALPDIISGGLATLGEGWIFFFIKIGIHFVIKWIENKLSSTTDAGELAQILRKALLKQGASGEFSILELLASLPLHITISNKGDFQDFFYADRPET